MSDSGIFNAAVKLAAEQRPAYLERACDGDAQLRREVESLLRAHEAPGQFLPDPPARAERTVEGEPITERPGSVIGPYKLMEQIGEGGFGLVFVAEQQRPVRRKVALKIIKPGMDTREVIARFEAERQALALMDHPNIARVLDAGATGSGRPFFVMELVKGMPLTEYCDQQRQNARQRLELFVSVCQAVQHAHAKGIIHRDLKPSNILVAPHDGAPVVKVIDFGVAKAIGQQLTEKTIYTRFAQMIGTPLYMSPEQAEINALDVDIRSDVYSLGVLLYELLTGTTPFDRQRFATAAFDEIRRIIKEEEPPKPSTRLSSLAETLPAVSVSRNTEPLKLSALVKGDLDWIVMKALEKDRSRRYETASAFAADVRRFLGEEPVEARPPSALYRFRKLVRRNKAAFATTAIVAAALVLGTAVSVWQAARAMGAEELAMARLKEVQEANAQATAALQQAQEANRNAEAVSRYLMGVFDAPRSEDGVQTSSNVTDFLDRASAKLDTDFAGEPRLKAEVLTALARMYLSSGSPHKAKPPLERALALRQEALGLDHPETVRSACELAAVFLTDSNFDFPRAIAMFEGLIPLAKMKLGPEHPDTVAALFHFARACMYTNQYNRAIPLFEETLALRRAHLGAEHRDTLACLRWLGEAHYRGKAPARAIPLWEEAFRIERKGPQGEECHSIDSTLAMAYMVVGQFDRAISLLEGKVQRERAKHGLEQDGTLAHASWLAEAYLQGSRLREAESLIQEVIAARKRKPRIKGESWREDVWIGHDLARLGDCLIKQDKGVEAEAVLAECLLILEKRPDAATEHFYATTLLGGSLLSQKRCAEAEPLLVKGALGLKGRARSLALHQKYRLPDALERLVRLYEAWGKPDEAAMWRAELESARKP